MRALQRYLSFIALCGIPAFAPAQDISTKKYAVHTIVLPFESRLVGVDDAGDLVGVIGNRGGFVFRPGDSSIEPLVAPLTPDTGVAPIAMNESGEVAVNFLRPQTIAMPWRIATYIYSIREKTYRPYAFHSATLASTCDSQVVAYNNAGQMFCGSLVASVGTPVVGAAGSFDDPGGTAAYTPFSCPDKPAATSARGENNQGRAVGTCLYAVTDAATKRMVQTRRAFVFDAASGAISMFDYPGSTSTTADSITDAGLILGTYVSGSEKGVFTYDGSRFARLEGVDADEPGKPQSLLADRYMINSRGEIIGAYNANNGRAFIAVPVGQTAPRVAEALSAKRISKLTEHALRERPSSGSTEDPNFPTGQFSFEARGYPMNWLAPGINVRAAGAPARYIGFNDQGSWFMADLPYRWNLQTKAVAFVLAEVPANLKTPAPPTAPVAQAAPVAPSAPTHGEQGKLTHAPDGNAYLSYVLPGPTPMNLKVVRPTNTKPAILTPAQVGPGDFGSWVFFGEGAQQAVAALVNLQADGTVTWQFLTPAMAHKYLEP